MKNNDFISEADRKTGIHRIIEMSSICAFLVMEFLLFKRVWESRIHFNSDIFGSSLSVLLTVILSYIAADFISGYVHFLGDSFGDENTPILGQSFIRPFREHHTDPKGITRHDFIETNGNNCIVSLPAQAAVYFLQVPTSAVWNLISLFTAFLLLWVFFTNQFHKWAHEDFPPRGAVFLQKAGIILSPEHHSVHHRSPYDRFYCITSGWLNPLLDRMNFFSWNRKIINKSFNKDKMHD
ncbi:MAG TPA: fatty acid desaturase family protein [Leptospiraceae bacterium]|nr:fatty acid desaturase family protein [Leptospiraceae bacterium]HNO24229.1 fatty acid desaturase family protein [Leptospiraceae bacterium]